MASRPPSNPPAQESSSAATLSDPGLPAQLDPPAFTASVLPPHALPGVEVVALPVLPGEDGGLLLGPGAEELGDLLGIDLLGVLEAERATGAVGEVVRVPVAPGSTSDPEDGGDTSVSSALRLVLLVGVGAQSTTDLRRAAAATARACQDRESLATTLAAVADDAGLEAVVVGATLGSFVFHWRSAPPEHRPVTRIVLADLPEATRPALDRAVAVAGAGWHARALASVPSNLKNPAWLADQAERLAARSGLSARVWDEQQLAAEGFGGIVGVGQASATPPRLIRLDYAPPKASRRTPTVVLVGKGITFDTGGLSIKPAEAMTTMKRDMTGGAVVMATMAALRAVGCPVRVIGLVAAAENAVSGSAMRPGDVVRHWGGRTTEVTNTDAEGRLVLADALAYAVGELDPAVVVDVATLTGAMKVALGQRTGGFFANRDALAAVLGQAAEASGEPLWRFPLAGVYAEKLSSKVADADNAPGGPGAIVAALFLQHFVGDVAWAHLDVASAGDSPTEFYEWTTGPTGFGARLLLSWLGSADPLAGLT